mgnify:CR=1 FL=1
MKIIIIGGVIAGVETALQARSNSETVDITIYDRDRDIAHTAYATHYVAGGIVKDVDQLTLNSPEWFKKRHNIDIHPNHDILKVDYDAKKVYGVDTTNNIEFEDSFDVLVFANGSSVTVPPVFRDKEFSNVFTIKSVQNARNILSFIKDNKPKTAVVVGAGYIGLGVSEQLTNAGIKVQTVDFLEYPMAQLDPEMSIHIADILINNGVEFYGNEGVTELNFEADHLQSVTTSAGNIFEADMFVVATGVRPNTELAESIGVETGMSRAIKVNEKLETNLPNVYAVGDVAEGFHAVTKEPLYLPLAATAVKMGRAAGDIITGGVMRFNGVLGTSAVRLFGQTIASTGMTESVANKAGFDPVVSVENKPAVLEIMGGKDILIKAVADAKTDKLLGVEMIGPEGVERRIDVFATAMQLGAKISDLLNLDLAFTPPISTPTDPVVYTALSLERAIKNSPFITPEQLKEKMESNEGVTVVDVRDAKRYESNHIQGAINIPIDELRENCGHLNKEDYIVVYCEDGEISGTAQRILVNREYTNVYNLSGGIENYQTQFEL